MAREQVSIEYTSSEGPFKVVLTSPVTDFFAHAKALPEIGNKEGEELVAALLKHAKGAISKVERYKDGRRNNGPHGEPAIQEFTDGGMSMSLYENGLRHDGARPGQPAYQRMNDSGQILHIAHYQDGKRNDGKHGEPAEQISDDRGNFIYIARYRDDKQTKMFTAQELAEFQAKHAPVAPKAKKEARSPRR
ncbi:MAG: hypothetical protein K8R48_01260 [Alphaproteobacteria bacterium]|nr:hypothetical protein [Alphaproteobacteria bacterium]